MRGEEKWSGAVKAGGGPWRKDLREGMFVSGERLTEWFFLKEGRK